MTATICDGVTREILTQAIGLVYRPHPTDPTQRRVGTERSGDTVTITLSWSERIVTPDGWGGQITYRPRQIDLVLVVSRRPLAWDEISSILRAAAAEMVAVA
jgi:hypothetical protein